MLALCSSYNFFSKLRVQTKYNPALFSERDLLRIVDASQKVIQHVSKKVGAVYRNVKMRVTCLPKYPLALLCIRCPSTHFNYYKKHIIIKYYIRYNDMQYDI